MTGSVTQEWLHALPLQQQSVCLLACRGHDGLAKEHPSKPILRALRAVVMRGAKVGRPIKNGEGDTFMTLVHVLDDDLWQMIVDEYVENHDEVVCHFYAHLMHAAEIVGYKHPDERVRRCFGYFYARCVDALHLNPETQEQLDARLSDWGQKHWDKLEAAE